MTLLYTDAQHKKRNKLLADPNYIDLMTEIKSFSGDDYPRFTHLEMHERIPRLTKSQVYNLFQRMMYFGLIVSSPEDPKQYYLTDLGRNT